LSRNSDGFPLSGGIREGWDVGNKLFFSFVCQYQQESAADADKATRRTTMTKIPPVNKLITSSSQVGNSVFIVIIFLIQITSAYSS